MKAVNHRDQRVLSVVYELVDWCESFTCAKKPVPSAAISYVMESIAIGDVVVWNSEDGYADGRGDVVPDAAGCIQCYQKIVAEMAAWLPEES